MATALERRARLRGRTQLRLLVFAIVLGALAYVLVVVGTTGRTPRGVVGFVAVIALAYLGAHWATRRLAPGADPAFLPAASALAGLGFAEVYRLDHTLASSQFVWLLVGLGLYVATLALVRDHRTLQSYPYTIGLVGIAFLLLPAAPVVGETINGARLWVALGPISFQPAEVSKILIVVFLAGYLDRNKELLALATRRIGAIGIPEPRHAGPLLLAWGGALAILFVENDLGSSLLFFGVFVVMLWVATGRSAYVIVAVLLFALLAWAGYRFIPHVQERVVVWLHALSPAYIHDQGYQLAQAEFAMAAGGIFGTGLGQGHPFFIPFAATDFIFAALGEETGLLGVTAVLLLYVVLVGRGLKAALSREDGFGKLLATGLAVAIGLQTFVIVGGVTRLIPLTGVTLPFVSYGGSSLVTNFVLLALLVRVSAPSPPPARPRRLPPAGGEPDGSNEEAP